MTALGVILFIAAAVWALAFAMRGSPLVTCGLYLIAASVFGVQFLDMEIGGASLSIDRIVFVGLLGMFALRVLTRECQAQPIGIAELWLAAFVGVLCLSTFTHDWRYSEPGHPPILPHLIEGYVIPVLLYWIARNSLTSARELTWLYALMILFAVYLAVTAVCEMGQLWSLVFPKYIADPQLGIHFGRARGPFLQSVRLGIYLCVGTGMTWALLVWRAAWGRAGQVLGILLCTFFMGAIALTYTRSVWAGLGAASLIVSLLTFRGRARRTVIVAALVGATLVGAVGGNLVAFKREFGAHETAKSTQMRAVFAYVSWLMFQDRPLTGFGFGHYRQENRPYLNDRSTELDLQSIRGYVHHNTFLSILVELGLLGFVPLMGLFLIWCRMGWQLWCDAKAPAWMRGHALFFMALLSSVLIQMAFHETSYSSVEHGALFLSAGILSGMAAMRRLPVAQPLMLNAAWHRMSAEVQA